jgi:hypothetical protein
MPHIWQRDDELLEGAIAESSGHGEHSGNAPRARPDDRPAISLYTIVLIVAAWLVIL